MLPQDIPTQTKAVEDTLIKYDNLNVADGAIAEMVYVLEKQYQFPRTLVAEYVDAVYSNHKINSNKVLFRDVLPIYVKRPALSFTDYYLSVYGDKNKSKPLLTFDQKLARQLPDLTELAK